MTIVRSHRQPLARRMAAMVFALLEVLAAVAVLTTVSSSASAQFWWNDRPRQDERARRRPAPPQQEPSFPFFRPWGGPWRQPWAPAEPAPQSREPRQAPVDYSKAPPPRKLETAPAATAVVLGDSMADWLGHGLEEVFSERAEIGVVRKIRANSGLIQGRSRSDSYDWVQNARDILANEKADYVVVMIGLGDRQSIRPPRSQPQQGGPPAPDPPAAAASEPAQSDTPQEFRTEKWAELYSKRIDDMIAALKSKGGAVFWVGLPPVRGTRSTADVVYLNQLFRARAEKAGIIYIDVWDGFADDAGAFTSQGPDFEGQTRRLRTADGVYFTKAGARKLAHYVDREIQRVIQARTTPVALPAIESPQEGAAAAIDGPAPRPAAGPVIPLTGAASAAEGLLGSGRIGGPSHQSIANQVLVKGVPIAAPTGRADDFSWPRQPGGDDAEVLPPVAPPAGPTGAGPLTPGQRPAPNQAPAAAPGTSNPATTPAPRAAASPPRPAQGR